MTHELDSAGDHASTARIQELELRIRNLTIVNEQLQSRIEMLEGADIELDRILDSAGVGLLQVDDRLRIRRYRPGFMRLMGPMPDLLGRGIAEVPWQFDEIRLEPIVRSVLEGAPARQESITLADGEHYLLRIAPYRDSDDQAGVLLSCTAVPRERAPSSIGDGSIGRTPREVTDALPVLIAYVDRHERYRFNNATYERWFGISARDMHGRYVREVLGEERYAVVGPYVKRALAGETVTYEMAMTLPMTGLRYLRVQYVPDKDDGGAVVGFFAAISDLTERHHAQEEIARLNRELSQRLVETQAILDAAPSGIFVAHDCACCTISMNRIGALMIGLEPDANPSKSGPDGSQLPYKLFKDGRELAPEELPMQYSATHDVAVHGTELELVRADGQTLTVLGRTAPLHDESGAVRGAVGAFLDITEYRRTEAALADTRQRLSLHMENSPLAVIEWNAERRITHWSAASERIFGWTAFEAIGRHIQDLPLIHEDDLADVERIMADLLTGSEMRNTWRNRNYRKDGSVIECDWYNSALRSPTGECISILSLALDITEHRRLEQLLRDHARRLAEADRRKDEFMAMLGHELRNPLVPIFNAARMLEVEGHREVTRRWACETIGRQSRHLLRLVDDLLDLGRINHGTIELQLQPVTLGQIVQDAIEANRHMIDERGHDLQVDLPQRPVRFLGDGTRLTQVVSNLLNNAAKYTPKGGIIHLMAAQDGNRVLIQVADNGRGIESEDLERIFDVFSENHRVGSGVREGLGLGLTLVRRLVELHDGHVEAHSAGLGKGATFTVRIPLHEAPAAEAEAPSSQAQHARVVQPRRILVVEDQAVVAQSFAVVLRAQGHEVKVAYTGKAALEAVDSFEPDVVLLDLGLPDMDGNTVAQRLARRPNRAAMRVVAVSGYVQSDIAADLQAIGFDAYLLKPVIPELLDEAIDKLFST